MRGAGIHFGLGLEGLSKNRRDLRRAAAGGAEGIGSLPEPIFTPSTKATTGHDENISFEETVSRIGRPLAERLRDTSLSSYSAPRSTPRRTASLLRTRNSNSDCRGDELIWIDEALTPDSSRFWPAAEYSAGKPQASFDKQYVRDYLERMGWNKQPPAPELPADVVAATRDKYREAYQRITGHALT